MIGGSQSNDPCQRMVVEEWITITPDTIHFIILDDFLDYLQAAKAAYGHLEVHTDRRRENGILSKQPPDCALMLLRDELKIMRENSVFCVFFCMKLFPQISWLFLFLLLLLPEEDCNEL
ncbi:hypothetical protein GQX74_011835 [Glossina fuscipes]|nr:hypothetical protein GQX74_011835 [Glossina fuscipes]